MVHATSPRIRAEDICDLPIVGGVAIDAAGERVAYVVTTMDLQRDAYVGSIRLVDVRGGTARTLTHGVARDMQPRWSPDGTRIAFISDRGERRQVWLIDPTGGDPYPAPEVEGDVSAAVFSPDGRRLAVIATPDSLRREAAVRGWRRIDRIRYRADGAGYLDDRPRLWIMDLTSGDVRAVTDGSGWVAAPAWSPDGARIAFAGEHRPDADSLWHTELWIADLAQSSAAPRKLLSFGGAIETPAWFPDGSRLAFVGFEEPEGYALSPLRPFVVGADGKGARALANADGFVCGNHVLNDLEATSLLGAPAIDATDGSLLVLASRRASAGVYRIATDGSASRLTPDAMSITEFAVAPSAIAACASTTGMPPEVYACSCSGEGWRRVTHDTRAWSADKGLVEAERFTVSARSGPIDTWLMRSAADGSQSKRHAAVVEIHGGPHFAYGESFFFEFQLLNAHGIYVVFCNPRGSQSYGTAFAHGLHGYWATPAFDDCMDALDAAIARGGIDTARLGVAGGSYGGYLTAWTVAHSDRFRAAIAMRPASNLASLWGTSEVGRMLESELGCRPLDDDAIYRRCSPLTFADAIRTPLLLLHAENDYRCPIEQSEQLFTALKRRGATVELMRFANADHGLSRAGPPRLRVARLQAIVRWFAERLTEASAG